MEYLNETNTSEVLKDGDVLKNEYTPENVILAVVLVIIVVVTIVGNLLVLLAFAVERQLRHPFNMFIFNLAVTDFLVAITAMSFYTVDSRLGYWPFGSVICGIWIYFDFAMTFASVFTMVAISIDRFWCVTWAQNYKIHNNRTKNGIILCIIWLCVIAIWTPPCIFDRMKLSDENARMCIWEPFENREFVIFVAVLGHFIPCIIMIACYLKVYYVITHKSAMLGRQCHRAAHFRSRVYSVTIASVSYARHTETCDYSNNKYIKSPDGHTENVSSRNAVNREDSLTQVENTSIDKKMSPSSGREKRIFRTLTYVLASYLICWLPIYITFDIYAWKPEIVPSVLYTILFWLAYINSTLNPLIYAYTSKDFRKGFIKVLKCSYKC